MHHHHATSDQHEELRKLRIKRDYDDLQKLQIWLNNHNPYDPERNQLQSLATGIVADEPVDCDEIQKSLDGISLAKATVKRSDRVVTLGMSKNTVKTC